MRTLGFTAPRASASARGRDEGELVYEDERGDPFVAGSTVLLELLERGITVRFDLEEVVLDNTKDGPLRKRSRISARR